MMLAKISVILLALCSVTWAHEDRVTTYKDRYGNGCCGPGTCHIASGVQFVTDPRPGYLLTDGRLIPEQEVLPSDDNNFWLCEQSGQWHCFFVPGLRTQ